MKFWGYVCRLIRLLVLVGDLWKLINVTKSSILKFGVSLGGGFYKFFKVCQPKNPFT